MLSEFEHQCFRLISSTDDNCGPLTSSLAYQTIILCLEFQNFSTTTCRVHLNQLDLDIARKTFISTCFSFPMSDLGSSIHNADERDDDVSSPLNCSWVLWEVVRHVGGKEYLGSLRPLCEFTTLEEYWHYMSHTPPPSIIFSDGANKKKVIRNPVRFVSKTPGTKHLEEYNEDVGHTKVDQQVHIEGLALFRGGIIPEWEHPSNADGAEWSFRKPLAAHVLDQSWEGLCLGLLSENIDLYLPTSGLHCGDSIQDEQGRSLHCMNQICGGRIVDKCTKGRAAYRVELWFRNDQNQEVANKLRQNLVSCLAEKVERSRVPRFSLRSHREALTMEYLNEQKSIA
eukprot:gb/GECG01003010.1/.p1 GENE.gb/GECG01003010.1/~~gb/GECG01003010.1/.p1  ORF type:complete len:341 (+),score=30.28 gb/GECG01003010.1/:1-1023(+)